MWNDVFKAISGNRQKSGVPGVPGVPPFGESLPELFLAEHPSKTIENWQCSGCSILPLAEHQEHQRKTSVLSRCSVKNQAGSYSDEYGAPGTPGTAQR